MEGDGAGQRVGDERPHRGGNGRGRVGHRQRVGDEVTSLHEGGLGHLGDQQGGPTGHGGRERGPLSSGSHFFGEGPVVGVDQQQPGGQWCGDGDVAGDRDRLSDAQRGGQRPGQRVAGDQSGRGGVSEYGVRRQRLDDGVGQRRRQVAGVGQGDGVDQPLPGGDRITGGDLAQREGRGIHRGRHRRALDDAGVGGVGIELAVLDGRLVDEWPYHTDDKLEPGGGVARQATAEAKAVGGEPDEVAAVTSGEPAPEPGGATTAQYTRTVEHGPGRRRIGHHHLLGRLRRLVGHGDDVGQQVALIDRIGGGRLGDRQRRRAGSQSRSHLLPDRRWNREGLRLTGPHTHRGGHVGSLHPGGVGGVGIDLTTVHAARIREGAHHAHDELEGRRGTSGQSLPQPDPIRREPDEGAVLSWRETAEEPGGTAVVHYARALEDRAFRGRAGHYHLLGHGRGLVPHGDHVGQQATLINRVGSR